MPTDATFDYIASDLRGFFYYRYLDLFMLNYKDKAVLRHKPSNPKAFYRWLIFEEILELNDLNHLRIG